MGESAAEALRCLGQLAKARALYEASVEAIGDGRLPPAVSALMWAQFSALEQETGDLDRAALLANRALLIGGPQDRHRAIARVQLGGVHHERGWTLLAREAYHLAHAQLLEIGDTRFLSLVEARLAALEAACDLDVAQGWLDAARGHVNDDRQLALTHRLYGGHLDLQRGHDVAALLASADTPVPGEPSPSPSAWNPEVRLATRLLQRAREAAS